MRRLPRSGCSTSEGDVEHQSPTKGGRERRAADASGQLVQGRVILRKIAKAIFTNIDDDITLQSEGTARILTVITLLKEALLGILIAFVAVSFVFFLNHRFLLGLPTARNVRKAAFHLLDDRETLKSFEEDSGLRFITLDEYASVVKEIDDAKNKTNTMASIVKERTDTIAELKKEKAQYDADFPDMFAALELDKFCEQCWWSEKEKVVCIQRATGLESTYQTTKFLAMLSAMKKKSCWKNEEQIEEERKRKVLEDELLKDLDEMQKDFCNDCEYDDKTSCGQRASFLNFRYRTPLDRGYARVMVEMEKCKISYHAEMTKKLEIFCPDCHWGYSGGSSMTCGVRVDYLMNTYKSNRRDAQLSAMEKPTCMRKEE